MRNIGKLILAFGVLYGGSSSLKAAEIQWNGFSSVGYENSSNEDYTYGGLGPRGSYESMTILGLNLSSSVSDRVGFAAQLVTNAEEDFQIQADWITGSFLITDGLSLRVGKVKFPVWQNSAYIDVKKTYPWAKPPREVYSLNPFKSFNGATLDYSLFMGDFEAQFELYYGRISQDLGGTAGLVTAEDLTGISAHFTYDYMSFKVGHAMGRVTLGDLVADRPTVFTSAGLTVDVANVLFITELAITDSTKTDSEEKAEAAATATATAAATAAGQAAQAAQADPTNTTLAKAAADAGLAAQGAGADALLKESDFFKNQAYFVTLGYRINEVTPHLTYASLDAKTDNPLFSEDQTSMTFGLLWDVNAQTAIKLDYSQVTVGDDSWGLFDKSTDGGTTVIPFADAPDDLEKTEVIRTSVDFIF